MVDLVVVGAALAMFSMVDRRVCDDWGLIAYILLMILVSALMVDVGLAVFRPILFISAITALSTAYFPFAFRWDMGGNQE